MKKLFTILALTAVLALSIAPAVSAQGELPNGCTMKYDVNGGGEVNCPGKTKPCVIGVDDVGSTATNCGLCCLLNTVYTVTNWIFFIMMTLAVVLIIIGGIMYMTAGANPDNTTKAKNFIVYAIVGLVIALIARFIPPIVKFILGVS